MHLCTCVSEEGGDGEGAGEGGDAKSSNLSFRTAVIRYTQKGGDRCTRYCMVPVPYSTIQYRILYGMVVLKPVFWFYY